eukprot:224090_1
MCILKPSSFLMSFKSPYQFETNGEVIVLEHSHYGHIRVIPNNLTCVDGNGKQDEYAQWKIELIDDNKYCKLQSLKTNKYLRICKGGKCIDVNGELNQTYTRFKVYYYSKPNGIKLESDRFPGRYIAVNPSKNIQIGCNGIHCNLLVNKKESQKELKYHSNHRFRIRKHHSNPHFTQHRPYQRYNMTSNNKYHSQKSNNLMKYNGYNKHLRPKYFGGKVHQFPNEWVNDLLIDQSDIHWKFIEWKAVLRHTQIPRYFMCHKDNYPSADPVAVPQFCVRGKKHDSNIEEFINLGFKFVMNQYQINQSLIPNSITLMKHAFNEKTYIAKNRQFKNRGAWMRLHYDWKSFFKVLWLNAKENNIHFEIPELGWKMAAIEKYEKSLNKKLALNIATGIYKGWMTKNKINDFNFLSDKMTIYINAHLNEMNINDKFDKYEDIAVDSKEKMLRNTKEFMCYIGKEGFCLASDETRFIKTVNCNILTVDILSKELLNTHKMLSDVTELVRYTWRIGLDFIKTNNSECKQFDIWIECNDQNLNQIDLYTSMKCIVNQFDADKEGNNDNNHTEDDKRKQFAESNVVKMTNVYSEWKECLLSLFKNKKEYNTIRNQWLELREKRQYLAMSYSTRSRPQKYKNALECCNGFNYPGKEILNYQNNNCENDEENKNDTIL